MITSPTDDLDPSGRISGQSSLRDDEKTEGTNTKSVLKAVMLLKRSRGSVQIDNKIDELESSSNTDQESENKLNLSLKRDVKSAPNIRHRTIRYSKDGRKINTTGLRRHTQKQLKNNHQPKFVTQRNDNAFTRSISSQPSSPNENIRRRNGKGPKREPCRTPESIEFSSDLTRNSRKTSSKKYNTAQIEAPTLDRPSLSPTPNAREQRKKHRSNLDDRWVASDKKFKVKEVVNTRIPGKENPVEVYQRFEPSMFAYIDTIKNLEKEKAIDPFGAKLNARAWLRKAKERLASGGSDYNPGQSPIIVIEEFCTEDGVWDGESGHESHDLRKDEAVVSNGNLETLLEDSDKENVAEEVTNVE